MSVSRTKILFLSFLLAFIATAGAALAQEIPGDKPSWRHVDLEMLAGILEFADLIAVDSIGDGTV